MWDALLTIPPGENLELCSARTAVGGRAPCAPGHPNGANPLAIVVPCHRVIKRRRLVGYGGGVPRKRWRSGTSAVRSHARDSLGAIQLAGRLSPLADLNRSHSEVLTRS